MSETGTEKDTLTVERGLVIGLAGLCTGLVIGALVFRSGPPPLERDPIATSAAPNLRVTESKKTSRSKTRDDTPTETSGESVPEGPVPGLATLGNTSKAPIAKKQEASPATEQPKQPAPPKEEMSSALQDAVAADKWFRATRLKIHRQLGSNALVSETGLTAPGQAILQRLRELKNHAVDPATFNIASLEDRATRYASADDRAGLEAHLGRALLRLTLHWRILKTAGPFKLVSEAKVKKSNKLKQRLADLAIQFGQSESVEDALAILDPPHPFYRGLVASYARYQKLADDGGCEKLPDRRLSRFSKGKHVRNLEKRLACEGYFEGEPDGVYDDDLIEAVKTYQRHHELDNDGAIGSESVRSLNVSMRRRAEQLRLAVHRVRESNVREMQDYYLVVNIPAYELRAVENNKIIRRNKVIVGTNRLDDDKVALIQGHLNRTKLFTSRLYQVIINPSWILPERIAKGELRSSLAKDPDYLEKAGIREKTLGNGTKVFVQGGGAGNVLGKVKFLLEKSNAIYLHDTDKKYLFNNHRRDYSHGCMRVHRAVEFAKWLLEKDGWDMKEVKRALGAEYAQRGMDLKRPPSFMTEYITVDMSAEGKPRFLTDVYKYDKDFADGNLPPKTRTRWGASRLRPHWVPRVPGTLVKEWKAQGKSAPRDRNWRPPASG